MGSVVDGEQAKRACVHVFDLFGQLVPAVAQSDHQFGASQLGRLL